MSRPCSRLIARRCEREGARSRAGAPRCWPRPIRNRVEVARLLIAAGADVNAKDAIEDSPFLYAGAEGRIEILKMTLAAGADLQEHQPLWRHRADSRPRITAMSRR